MSSSSPAAATPTAPAGPARGPARPGPEALARLSAEHAPVLLCVVDTEEEFDWSGDFDRAARGVRAMAEIERFQRVFDEFGVRPVYVVDHPVAASEEGRAPLVAFHADGRAEIGAHLHPWVNPPHDEAVTRPNSYPGNLPPQLERAKLEELCNVLREGFGAAPRVYKAGRYGLGPRTWALLEDLGFECDLSPCPPFDYSADGGPDYSRFPVDPFWCGARRPLLCVPTTGAFAGWLRAGGPELFRVAQSLAFARVPGILSRLGAFERLLLSPEGYEPEHHRRVTRTLYADGVRTFTFSFHSPSALPGCTPYVRSEAEREAFLDACRRYLDFFLGELGGVSMTATELAAHLLLHRPPRTP